MTVSRCPRVSFVTLSRPPDIGGCNVGVTPDFGPEGWKINWTSKKQQELENYLCSPHPVLWEVCGQFYLHLVFTPGMLLMKLLYTRTFFRNVDSAKMTSREKTNINSVRDLKVSMITITQKAIESLSKQRNTCGRTHCRNQFMRNIQRSRKISSKVKIVEG